MDLIYILIVVVFAVIVYCDYMDKKLSGELGQNKKEGFANYEIDRIGGFNEGPYVQERPLVNYSIGNNQSSVNFNYRDQKPQFQKFRYRWIHTSIPKMSNV